MVQSHGMRMRRLYGGDFRPGFRRRLLCGSALSAVLTAAAPGVAWATCSTTSPADGATVECTATGGAETGSVSGNDDVTVNVRDGAALMPGSAPAISLNDGATILVEEGAQINGSDFRLGVSVHDDADITIDGAVDAYAGIAYSATGMATGSTGFSNSMITVGEGGSITTDGSVYGPLNGAGGGNTYQIDGLLENNGIAGYGIRAGTGDDITIGATGRVAAHGSTASGAIDADGFPAATGITVTVDEGGAVETDSAFVVGVDLGDDAEVTVNGTVKTATQDGNGAFDTGAAGIKVGANSTVEIGETGVVTTSFDGATGGTSLRGISAGAGSTVTVNGMVETWRGGSYGIFAAENGGVTVGGNVTTHGDDSFAAYLHANSTFHLEEGASITTSGANATGVYGLTESFSGTDTLGITIDGMVSTTGTGAEGLYFFPYNRDVDVDILVSETGSVMATNAAAIAAEPGSSLSPFYPDANIHLTLQGTVSGPDAGSVAVDFGDGNDTLELYPGFSLTGYVDAGTIAGDIDSSTVGDSVDTFILGGSGTASFDVSRFADDNSTRDAGEQFFDFNAFAKNGDSTWTLTGANGTADMDWQVDDGMLFVNADFTGAMVNFDVNAGAVLGGSGTFSGLQVNAGGAVAPGNSIGTMNVATADFGPGGNLIVEVNSGGNTPGVNNDHLVASGAVTIDPGAGVYVNPENGTDTGAAYAASTVYTIVTGDTVTGSFGGVGDAFAFLDASLSYDPMHVYLTLTRNALSFTTIADTPNQMAAAGGAEETGSGNPIFDAIIGLSEEEARAAFDALSGEIHASGIAMMIDDSRFVRDAVNERMRGAFGGTTSGSLVTAYFDAPDMSGPAHAGPAYWGQVFGGWGDLQGDGNAANLTRGIGGMFVGVDAPTALDMRMGLAAGYSRSAFDVDDRASSGTADTFHLAAYAGGARGGFEFDAGAALAIHRIETTRTAAFGGFAEMLAASYGAMTSQFFGEVRRPVETPRGRFIPFVNAALVHHHMDGFTETGGVAALTVASASETAGFTTVGLRAETELDAGAQTVRLMGSVGWRHGYGDLTASTSDAFSGGTPFAISGAPVRRDAAVVEAGLAMRAGAGGKASFSYQGEFGGGSQHALKAMFSRAF